MRRIDEVIDYCKFHSGDRIGHGIALGISAEEWVKENSKVIIPQGEYLDNLLWIWGVYTKISDINYKTHSYLQHKIYEVVKNILANEFDYDISIEMLYETYKRRFKEIPEILELEMGNISITDSDNELSQTKWSTDRLMRLYHDRIYLERFAAPVYVNTTDIEKEITVDMQRYVRRKVAMNGIVIEVNPSSNHTIGEMNSLFENQFFRSISRMTKN